MEVIVTEDAREFAQRTRTFLTSRPVECNVLATVLASLDPDGGRTVPPVFAWVEQAAQVRAAALRTPPRPLLASAMTEAAAAALMAVLIEADPSLPGVNAPQPTAGHLAEAWLRSRAGAVERGMATTVYSLTEVEELRHRPSGEARRTRALERELLVGWTRAFARHAGVPEGEVGRGVDRRLSEGRLFVWDNEGAVCMVGCTRPVAGVVRVAPVYTPPEARRRGYATALVSEVSRWSLASGASQCMLFADLSNPTSNSIYRAVGYRRSHDAQEYLFRT